MDFEGHDTVEELSGLVSGPNLSSGANTWVERGGISNQKSGGGSGTVGSSGLDNGGNSSEDLTVGELPVSQFPVLEESMQFLARKNARGDMSGGGGSKGATLR